jgi:mRNA interferase RelE/StbE
VDGIERLRSDPASAANVKALIGRDDYRLRVGDYRVFFFLEPEAELIVIASVQHRREAYR